MFKLPYLTWIRSNKDSVINNKKIKQTNYFLFILQINLHVHFERTKPQELLQL